MAQKTGALIFDETADRYDIRFDIADYYGGRREERTPFFHAQKRRTTLTLSLLPGKEDGKHCKMKSTKKWLRSLSREQS